MPTLERTRASSPEGDEAQHYVIEVDGPDGPRFAICEQVMLVDAAAGAVPAGSLDRLVRGGGGRLLAAAMPAAGSSWLRVASFAQSADDEDEDEE